MVSKTQLEKALHSALNDARDCNEAQTGSGWRGGKRLFCASTTPSAA